MKNGKHTDETMHKGLTYYVVNGQVTQGEYKGKKLLPFVFPKDAKTVTLPKEIKLSDLELTRNLELYDMKNVYWVEVESLTAVLQPKDIDTKNWINKPTPMPVIKEKE